MWRMGYGQWRAVSCFVFKRGYLGNAWGIGQGGMREAAFPRCLFARDWIINR